MVKTALAFLYRNEVESQKVGKGSFAYAWVLDETGEERTRYVLVDLAYYTTVVCVSKPTFYIVCYNDPIMYVQYVLCTVKIFFEDPECSIFLWYSHVAV